MNKGYVKHTFLITAIVCLSAPGAIVLARPATEYGKVELLRDAWGVPHVFADTDQGAMYGLGYACAEDRGYQMNYFLRMMANHMCVFATDDDTADVIFESVFPPGDTITNDAGKEQIRVFVSDGQEEPDFERFDYAFSPNDLARKFPHRHSQVPLDDYYRSDNYSVDLGISRSFFKFLFPLDAEPY